MINNKKVLENTFPNPLTSLRIMNVIGLFCCAFVVMLCYYLPHLFFIWVFIGITGLVAIEIARRILRDYKLDKKQFTAKQHVASNGMKIHPDEQKIIERDKHKPIEQREGTYWKQKGPGFTDEQIEEKISPIDGSVEHVYYWRRVLLDSERESCREMTTYLSKHWSYLYDIVMDWWNTYHRKPVGAQLYPGIPFEDLDKVDRKIINKRTEVELYQGVYIALQPERWTRRIDSRPSHKSYSILKKMFYDALDRSEWPTEEALKKAPIPYRYKHKWIYIGEGFHWHARHTLKLFFKKFLDGDDGLDDEVSTLRETSEKRKVDRRLFWTGWKEKRSIWLHYDDDLAQHGKIEGGTGMGKTSLAVSFIIAAIYNGSALIWLDPKIDAKTIAIINYHAKLAGREDDLTALFASRADLAYNNTFNVGGGYKDPSQMGSILAGMLPPDAGQNQYFVDEAIAIGRITATVIEFINRYLSELSDGDDLSSKVPKLVLWIEYCRLCKLVRKRSQVDKQQVALQAEEHYKTFESIYDRLCNSVDGFNAKDEIETELLLVWNTKQYTPRFWKFTFDHINMFPMQNRQRLVSWGLRIIYAYVYAENELFADPRFPMSDNQELVTGVVQTGQQPQYKDKEKVVELFEKSGSHILSKEGLQSADQQKLLWSFMYEQCISVTKVQKLQKILERFDRAINEQIAQAQRSNDDYGPSVSSLRAPISEVVSGDKYGLVCSPDPDVTWDTILESKKIVIFAPGTMSDEEASDSLCKLFTQSLVTHAGYLQDHGGAKMDCLFMGDEIASWINKFVGTIFDKIRALDLRFFAMTQSTPGMQYKLGSKELVQHILSNARCRFIFATQLPDDARKFCDGFEKVEAYTPNRVVSENPDQGNMRDEGTLDWGSGESWNWSSKPIDPIEPQWISNLPKGQAFMRIQKELTLVQTPLFDEAPESYQAMIGMDDLSGANKSLIAGVDYDNDGDVDHSRMQDWGQTSRLTGSSDIYSTNHLDEPQHIHMLPLDDMFEDELNASDSELVHPPEEEQYIDDQYEEYPDEEKIMVSQSEIDDQGLVHTGIRDMNRLRQGFWTVKHADGREHSRGSYKNDKAFGTWIFYDEHGSKETRYLGEPTTQSIGQTTPVEASKQPDAAILEGIQDILGSESTDAEQEENAPEPAKDPSDALRTSLKLEPEDEIIEDANDSQVTIKIKESGYKLSGSHDGHGKRVGIWTAHRPDGTISQVHYYNEDGNPTGSWERYDTKGHLVGLFTPSDLGC